MNYAQRIATNLAVQLLGRGLMLATALATLKLVTRLLGAEGFGHYSIALVIVGLLGVAAELGINVLAVRELAAGAPPGQRLAELLGLRLAVAVPLLLLAPAIAWLVPAYAPEVVTAASVLAVAQLLLLGAQLGGCYFQAKLRMDLVMAAEVLGRVATLGLLWWSGDRMTQTSALLRVVAAVAAGAGLSLACSTAFLLASGVVLRPTWAPSAWRRLGRAALPIGVAGVLLLVHFRADSVVLSLLRPAVEVGVYGIAYRILEILVTFPVMLSGILLPRFVAERHDAAVLGVLFDMALRLVLAVAAPIAAYTALYAGDIVHVLAGRSGFEPAAVPLRILAAALPALFAGALAGMAAVAVDRQGSYARRLALAGAVSIALNFALVPRYSYLACAWITLATELLCAGLGLWLLRDIQPVRRLAAALGRAAAAGVVWAPAAWLLHGALEPAVGSALASDSAVRGVLVLAASGGLYLAAFAAAALLTRLVRIEEVRMLRPRWRAGA